jgi:hypothetical protein
MTPDTHPCPYCSGWYTLTKGGGLRAHKSKVHFATLTGTQRWALRPCPGSGQEPVYEPEPSDEEIAAFEADEAARKTS